MVSSITRRHRACGLPLRAPPRSRLEPRPHRERLAPHTRATIPASSAVPGLLQLAVFAASAVVEALVHVEPVRLGLARDALPDARQCVAPRFGDRLAALLTGEEALSLRKPAPRPFDSAVDRRVDLILHRAVLRPTDRHGQNIGQGRTVSRRRQDDWTDERYDEDHAGREASVSVCAFVPPSTERERTPPTHRAALRSARAS